MTCFAKQALGTGSRAQLVRKQEKRRPQPEMASRKIFLLHQRDEKAVALGDWSRSYSPGVQMGGSPVLDSWGQVGISGPTDFGRSHFPEEPGRACPLCSFGKRWGVADPLGILYPPDLLV